MTDHSFFTLAVHAGEDREANYGAVSMPVYNSAVFAFPDADEADAIHNERKPGYYYGRNGNPTTAALERIAAELEGGEAGLAFASGMAAISGAILSNVSTRDHIVAPVSMYATTTRLLNQLQESFGLEISYVDASEAGSYADATRPNTKVYWIETPSNPVLGITDIRKVAAAARDAGITTIADNTFATPFNQRPIGMGVDIVIHSATKYLGGHSDLTAGLLISSSANVQKIRNVAAKLFGGNIAPQVAWLVMRGIKTLALRMDRHNSNAYALANMLAGHSKVKEVFYPGLETHRDHTVAKAQMSPGFGGMLSLDLGSLEHGKAFANNVRLCSLATSLGGVESLVQHSASMTHASLSAVERQKAGISDGLIRFSVGIEDISDLTNDVLQALERI